MSCCGNWDRQTSNIISTLSHERDEVLRKFNACKQEQDTLENSKQGGKWRELATLWVWETAGTETVTNTVRYKLEQCKQ